MKIKSIEYLKILCTLGHLHIRDFDRTMEGSERKCILNDGKNMCWGHEARESGWQMRRRR